MIHDKREYAKFEKERVLAKWDRVSLSLFAVISDRTIDDEINDEANVKICRNVSGRESTLQTSDFDLQQSDIQRKHQGLIISGDLFVLSSLQCRDTRWTWKKLPTVFLVYRNFVTTTSYTP